MLYVPIALRTLLVQRVHLGLQTGHKGSRKTLAGSRERYVWEKMVQGVDKVLKNCIQCWRQNTDTTKKIPLGALLRGWPKEETAMDLFGPLPKTKNGNVFILLTITRKG